MSPLTCVQPPATPRKRKFMFFPMSSVLAHVSHALETAKVLRARGHDVVFAGSTKENSRSRWSVVEREGFRVVEAGEPDFEYLWDALLKWGYLGLYIEFSRPKKWMPFGPIMESQVRAIKDEQPDVVIGAGALTMTSSAYAAGVPSLNIHNAYLIDFVLRHLYFRYWWLWYDWKFLAPQRLPVYKRYGKKPVRAMDLYRSVPLLSPDLPGLYETCAYFSNARQIGPILFDFPAPLPEWFGELDDGTPNVYITMGSTGRMDSFLRQAYEHLAKLPYRFVVTTAGQATEETVRMAPQNFRFAKYAPGAELLRHCAGLVFHGGNGSMYQALAAGVPMLAIPTHYEQVLNSNFAVRGGFCARLRMRKARTPALACAIRDIVEDPKYREAARRMQDIVRITNGATAAADACEHAAEAGVPTGSDL